MSGPEPENLSRLFGIIPSPVSFAARAQSRAGQILRNKLRSRPLHDRIRCTDVKRLMTGKVSFDRETTRESRIANIDIGPQRAAPSQGVFSSLFESLVREVGANPGESQAGDLHVALARKCVAGALNDELGYTVRILGIQRIVFIHRQILRRRPSRGIIATVNRHTRSHHELLDSGGKSRRYHVITLGYVVTEYCRVAEHVGSFPRTRLRIESVASIGK